MSRSFKQWNFAGTANYKKITDHIYHKMTFVYRVSNRKNDLGIQVYQEILDYYHEPGWLTFSWNRKWRWDKIILWNCTIIIISANNPHNHTILPSKVSTQIAKNATVSLADFSLCHSRKNSNYGPYVRCNDLGLIPSSDPPKSRSRYWPY